MNAEQEIRERLRNNLDKLSRINSVDLIREDALGSKLSFRAGIPFFDRTLTLYRQLANTNLSRVPSAILEIAANHAEESLRQFEQLQAFNPAGMDRPEQVRNILMNDIRDAHAAIYEDLSILILPSRTQIERVTKERSWILKVSVLALLIAGAILQYRYSLLEGVINNLQDFAHDFLKH